MNSLYQYDLIPTKKRKIRKPIKSKNYYKEKLKKLKEEYLQNLANGSDSRDSVLERDRHLVEEANYKLQTTSSRAIIEKMIKCVEAITYYEELEKEENLKKEK